MNPFQASYFIKNNGKKVAIVLIMLTLISMLYVGGSYLSNIYVEAEAVNDRMKDWAWVAVSSGDLSVEALQEFMADMEKNPDYRIMKTGSNHLYYPTTLGFTNGQSMASFTLENFLWMNQREHYLSDTGRVADNTIILSARAAEYLNLKDGDLFTENREELIVRVGTAPYTVLVSDEIAEFFCVVVTEDASTTGVCLLTYSDSSNAEKFAASLTDLKKQYPKVYMNTYAERVVQLKSAFAINNLIFVSIILVVTCVFFITINAVLVGIYDKRKNEFVLYRSIGIPEKAIYGKITKELVLMTVIGIIAGLIVSMLVIFLLNALVYRGTGLHLRYCHFWCVTSFFLCHLCILLPSLALRIRMVKKIEKEGLDV